jgi:hypothetical protein
MPFGIEHPQIFICLPIYTKLTTFISMKTLNYFPAQPKKLRRRSNTKSRAYTQSA